MSDTPRTDKAEFVIDVGCIGLMAVSPADMRDVERELAESKCVSASQIQKIAINHGIETWALHEVLALADVTVKEKT